MRSSSLASLGLCVLITTAACGNGGSGDDGDDAAPDAAPTGELQPPAMGFQLVTPYITLAPLEETTKCWYFQTPNAAALGVQRWESQMTPGSHHMIVYFTTSAQQPHGTLTDDCGGGLSAVWTYASQSPYTNSAMPNDPDSTPSAIGMGVGAGQTGFIQMHYLNPSDAPLQVRVTLNAHAYPDGTAYTPTSPYITFNTNLSIPPASTQTFTETCTVAPGRKFFQLSTHAHKQATHTEVRDGGAVVFESDDWAHPGARLWDARPFHTFASNQITYECMYYNADPNRTINTGDSAQTDEMCMAVGYMFPAMRPTICLDSLIVTQ
jgi:hypothetical protein